jgi:hypothetical protein
MNAMTIYCFKIIVCCEALGVVESFRSTCFGHAFFKACQYATTKETMCKDLTYVSILHKCITWPKKVREKNTRMCENLHYYKPQAQKIEHTNQTR